MSKKPLKVVVTFVIEMNEDNIEAYCGTYGMDAVKRTDLKDDFKTRALTWIDDAFNGTGEFFAKVTVRK